GRPAALADDPAALTLGTAAPHALLLTALERVLQAGAADATASAHRLPALRLVVGLGVEDPGVETPTRPQLPPVDFLYRHGSPPRRVECEWMGCRSSAHRRSR